MIIFLLLVLMYKAESKIANEKLDFCANLQCGDSEEVCGIRDEGNGFRLRLFDNECELLKYGCSVEDNLAYGVTSLDYCERTFDTIPKPENPVCTEFDCSYPTDAKEVCGIIKDGECFRIKLFENKCKLWQHNCENKVDFTECEHHICNGLNPEYTKNLENSKPLTIMNKNIIIVDNSMINFNNFNESIENFFAATHVFDLPIKEVHQDHLNETSRRMLIHLFGPVKVFKPWITIPKNISEDNDHTPTLSSCFHKCPKTSNLIGALLMVKDRACPKPFEKIVVNYECPDTYAPVCGVPGILAREPNLMFQNHCFMDVAQCKMYWEDKSPTALSSNYIESSFLFCLGDELNGLYRFLPLIRTLQHMGRLKKRGHYRYKLKNMRFFNNLLAREPKLMG